MYATPANPQHRHLSECVRCNDICTIELDSAAIGMNLRCNLLASLVLSLWMALGAGPTLGQDLTANAYYWYAPEHEKYGRTSFYLEPTFHSATVRVNRTQRFRLTGASKGWAQIEFDVAGKAYVHVRILRNLMSDSTASDPWYEFQRASVFTEDPAKVEARIKSPAPPTTPSVVDSKTPSWKRYKDAWGLKPGRAAPAAGTDEAVAETTQSPPRPGSLGSKPRNKHPLLPPIGSEPPPEKSPEASERDAESAPAR